MCVGRIVSLEPVRLFISPKRCGWTGNIVNKIYCTILSFLIGLTELLPISQFISFCKQSSKERIQFGKHFNKSHNSHLENINHDVRWKILVASARVAKV